MVLPAMKVPTRQKGAAKSTVHPIEVWGFWVTIGFGYSIEYQKCATMKMARGSKCVRICITLLLNVHASVTPTEVGSGAAVWMNIMRDQLSYPRHAAGNTAGIPKNSAI